MVISGGCRFSIGMALITYYNYTSIFVDLKKVDEFEICLRILDEKCL